MSIFLKKIWSFSFGKTLNGMTFAERERDYARSLRKIFIISKQGLHQIHASACFLFVLMKISFN